MAETSWGKLGRDRDAQMSRIDFLSKLSNFVSTLNGAQESINDRIELKSSDKYDLTQYWTKSRT